MRKDEKVMKNDIKNMNSTTQQFGIFQKIGVCELTNVKSPKYLQKKIENYYGIKTRVFKKEGRTFIIPKH